jgi:hypothetical protein
MYISIHRMGKSNGTRTLIQTTQPREKVWATLKREREIERKREREAEQERKERVI